MPKGYHRDLRERVIEECRRGTPRKAVAEQFKIGVMTVYRWWRAWVEEERLEALSGYQHGYSPKVNNLDAFRAFVELNPDKTMAELGKSWEQPCSDATIHKFLGRIGYTFKKRDTIHGAGCRKSSGISGGNDSP